MRIRSRRLRWGLIGCLAFACIGLIRPARTWLDQRVLAPWFDPNLSISQLHLHASRGVLELRELQWSARQGSQTLGITAERGWLAFEAEPLLDKRLSIPKLLLEKTQLQLTDVAVAESSGGMQANGGRLPGRSVWQEALMERVQSLDWQQLTREFMTFLADDDLPRTWHERMERWIARSQQAAQQALSLEASTTSLANPLRLESEQQLKLQQLAGVLQEQLQVSQQFASLEQLVAATIRRVEERMEQDVERSMQVVEQQTADPGLVTAIAAEMVRDAAHRAWAEVRGFAEVAERVARAQVGPGSLEQASTKQASTEQWNIDVRSLQTPAMAISEVRADGIFNHGQRQTPFQLLGEYQAAQQADYRYQHKSMWHIIFNEPTHCHSVFVAQRHGSATINSATINSATINDLQLSSAVAEQPAWNRLVLASDGATLDGEFTLLPQDWSELFEAAPHDPISVKITGDWRQAAFEVIDPLPEWLREAARQKIEVELLRTHGKLVAELETQATQRLTELRGVQSELQSLALQNGRHGTQIATIEAKLQSHFLELNRSAKGDVEYARRLGRTLR